MFIAWQYYLFVANVIHSTRSYTLHQAMLTLAYLKQLGMDKFIIGSILVILIVIFIVLRLKKKTDDIDPPHSPLQ